MRQAADRENIIEAHRDIGDQNRQQCLHKGGFFRSGAVSGDKQNARGVQHAGKS